MIYRRIREKRVCLVEALKKILSRIYRYVEKHQININFKFIYDARTSLKI